MLKPNAGHVQKCAKNAQKNAINVPVKKERCAQLIVVRRLNFVARCSTRKPKYKNSKKPPVTTSCRGFLISGQRKAQKIFYNSFETRM